MLASVMPDGWFLYRATDVAVDGDIVTVVGHGTNPSGKDEAWIATFSVPEPSSMLALTLALLGLGGAPVARQLRTAVAHTKRGTSFPGLERPMRRPAVCALLCSPQLSRCIIEKPSIFSRQ